jgi:hypothetical protein
MTVAEAIVWPRKFIHNETMKGLRNWKFDTRVLLVDLQAAISDGAVSAPTCPRYRVL